MESGKNGVLHYGLEANWIAKSGPGVKITYSGMPDRINDSGSIAHSD